MRSSVLLPILACVATAGCSSVTPTSTLSTDVWLCAYQLGDRYRDDTVKPDSTGLLPETTMPQVVEPCALMEPL